MIVANLRNGSEEIHAVTGAMGPLRCETMLAGFRMAALQLGQRCWPASCVAQRPTLMSSGKENAMKVFEIMSKRLFTCDQDDSLQRAAQLMWEQDVGCVPVTHEKRVVGMITDRDICMSAYLNGKLLSDIRVRDVMSRNMRSCSPGDNVSVVAEHMAKAQVRRLPVIEDDSLVGLVSLNDLAIAGLSKKGPRPEDVAVTLAQISHHRAGNSGVNRRVA